MSSEEARLARERRLAKIKAGGANRLAKITGRPEESTAPNPSDKTSKSSDSGTLSNIALSKTDTASLSDDYDPPVVSPDHSNSMSPSPFAVHESSPGAQSMASLESDPLFKLLSGQLGQLGANANGGGDAQIPQGAPAGMPPGMDFMSLFNQSFNPQQLSEQLKQAQPSQPMQPVIPEWRQERREFIWGFLHILSSVLVGLYIGLYNPYSISILFVSVQVALNGTKILLGHRQQVRAVSMLAPFLSMLSADKRKLVNEGAALITVVRSAYKDFGTTLFVYGLCAVGASYFNGQLASSQELFART